MPPAQPPYLFLDTEFVQESPPAWLSLGLVGLDGTELYLELNPTSDAGIRAVRRSNRFVKNQVLPQFGRLPQQVDSLEVAGLVLDEWLTQTVWRSSTERLFICYDWSTDFDLLEQLLDAAGRKGWWQPKLDACNLAILNEDPTSESAREAVYSRMESERGVLRHHALVDAWALRAAYLAHAVKPHD